MKATSKNISKNLIRKLDMSKQILQQGSSTVHNKELSKDFRRLALIRNDFQRNLASITGIDL